MFILLLYTFLFNDNAVFIPSGIHLIQINIRSALLYSFQRKNPFLPVSLDSLISSGYATVNTGHFRSITSCVCVPQIRRLFTGAKDGLLNMWERQHIFSFYEDKFNI